VFCDTFGAKKHPNPFFALCACGKPRKGVRKNSSPRFTVVLPRLGKARNNY
jgi:hypothetical protein